MIINTEIAKRNITVEIEGKEYDVIEKTVGNAKKLMDIDKKMLGKSLQYQLWLEALKIYLGENAINELFPTEDEINLDKLELIYNGAAYAFNANNEEIQNQDVNDSVAKIENIMEKIKPINDTINSLNREQKRHLQKR